MKPLHDRLQVINDCKPGCGNEQCRYLEIKTKTLGPNDAFVDEVVPTYFCLRDDPKARKIIDMEVLAAKADDHPDAPFGKGCETVLDEKDPSGYDPRSWFDRDVDEESECELPPMYEPHEWAEYKPHEEEMQMFPYNGPVEPIDYVMSEIVADAMKHAEDVCRTGKPIPGEPNEPYTKAERVGHFVTTLRRYLTNKIALGTCPQLDRYNQDDIFGFIRSRILDTALWEDIGVVNPKKFLSTCHYFQSGKFNMTAERIQHWAHMPQKEEDSVYREIERLLAEMADSIDNMNHHTSTVRQVNDQGERVLQDFRETVASVYDR